jgi:hypothetical protein
MKLVEDWKRAWTWYSIHAASVLVLVSAAQELLPLAQPVIPPAVFPWVALGLGILVIAGRLLAQKEPQ